MTFPQTPTQPNPIAATSGGNFDAGSFVTASLATDQVANQRAVGQPSVNPYAAPTQPALEPTGPNGSQPQQLLSLKKLRTINLFLQCAGNCLVLAVCFFVLPIAMPSMALLGLVAGIAILLSWGSIIFLAYHSRSLGSAIFTTIISFCPILNLLVFLSVYDRSRKILKENGYKAGWLKMELTPEAHQCLVNATAAAPAELPVKQNKERSTASLIITYGSIGLLIGMIVVSLMST